MATANRTLNALLHLVVPRALSIGIGHRGVGSRISGVTSRTRACTGYGLGAGIGDAPVEGLFLIGIAGDSERESLRCRIAHRPPRQRSIDDCKSTVDPCFKVWTAEGVEATLFETPWTIAG